MIVCDNCSKIFANESELDKILVVSEKGEDGYFYTVECMLCEEGYELKNTDEHREEVFSGCGSCCTDDWLTEVDKDCIFSDEEIEQIWDILEDVPFDKGEYLAENWFGFPKGTAKEDIWQWFDTHYSKGANALIN